MSSKMDLVLERMFNQTHYSMLSPFTLTIFIKVTERKRQVFPVLSEIKESLSDQMHTL